jgi:hypothetical protein
MESEGLAKRKAGRIFNLIIKYELLLLAAAVPVLILPCSYLWKWQQGLSAYAPVGGKGAEELGGRGAGEQGSGGAREQGGWGDGERGDKENLPTCPHRMDGV